MQQIVDRIVAFFEKKGAISTADREVYAYGVDAALYTFISTAGLILIGCLWERTLETVLIISIFYINQSLGGGFHATTHRKCFLTMAVGLMCCLSMFRLPNSLPVYSALAVISLILMMKYPLILHKNKAHLATKQKELCKRSRILLAVQAIFLILVVLCGNDIIIQAFCMALVGCGVSRISVVLRK